MLLACRVCSDVRSLVAAEGNDWYQACLLWGGRFSKQRACSALLQMWPGFSQCRVLCSSSHAFMRDGSSSHPFMRESIHRCWRLGLLILF